MFTILGKSLVWVITSALGISIGVGALIFNKSASANPAGGNNVLLPHFPHFPVWPPPHHVTPPAVPEVNTGLVLLPIVLAILVFASRFLLHRRNLENQ